ncbi:50S ribosomal protein L4 [Patescibacteria group bacterium]|nr:50S ribosomal protein L4 [Patescibacteria group bacterium]
MKVAVYDKTNKQAGEMDLPETLFGLKWNADLVHQVVTGFLANLRKPWAHAKDRSEVRGGGKKPWRQKHTGHSRHGSSRSPIWIGGGAAHGPRKERSYAVKINRKMQRLALLTVLSKKLKDEVKVIDDLSVSEPKTKNVAAILSNFFKRPASLLIVGSKENKHLNRAARNLPKVEVRTVNNLNVYDCLSHKNVFFEKAAVAELIDKYSK